MKLQVVIENHAVHSCDDIKFSNFCTVGGNGVKLNKAVDSWAGHHLGISVICGTYNSITSIHLHPLLSTVLLKVYFGIHRFFFKLQIANYRSKR